MQSPVAILQKQRQYRASSLSQNHPNYQQQLGTSAGTPSSLTSSFIDHAFDHPTPTSFSQLQFLSSSVASNDGSDYTHRVPKVEERFCSGFNCCGLDLDDLHHLLEHFEECHVLPGGQVTGNPTSIPEGSSVAAAAAAAARMAANGADGSISSAASSTHTSPVLSSAGIGTSASSATSPSSGGSGGSVIAGSRRGSKQDEPKLSSAIAEGAERQMSNEDMMEEDNEDEGHHDMPQFDDFDEEHTADAATMALLAGGSANLTANSLASGTNLAALAPPGQQTAGIAAGMSTAGSGPMLSAPPSPAMSSASDHHITAGNGSSGSLYELGSKRRTFSNANNAASNLPSSTSASTFPNFSRRQAPSIHSRSSRSPPSGAADDAVSLTSDTDDGASTATHLPFSRKMRQQSVDSLASVSTQGSTSSKKRSYNAAIGAPATTSSTGTGIAPAQLTKTNSRLSFSGLDMNTFRGMTHARSTSGLSTPDSSVPGTPASEYDAYGNEESVLGTGTGCLPPSLLYPLNRASPEDMTTDEEGADGEEDDDDDDDDLQAFLGYGNGGRSFTTNESGMDEDIDVEQYSQQLQLQQQIGGSGSSGSDGAQPNAAKNFSAFYSHQPMQPYNMSALSSTPTASMPEPDNKKKRMSSTPNLSAGMPSKPPKKSAGGGSNKKKAQQQAGNAYDSNADNAAAAMFLPLSLLSGPSGGNIPVGQASTSSGSSGSNGSGQASGADAAANIAVPVVTDSTSPNSQATASAATLAAIQAAAASAAFPDASTPTGRIWVPNNAKPFKCPIPGCDKAYKQQNGLKYHRLHGHCNSNAVGKEGEEEVKEEDKPFGCYVGPACGKKYKNMNGLRYHYQHSGAHGQIGLQMLSNGTHPPPAYPPGHKRSNMKHNGAYSTEFSSNPASTVVMNQSTAEALLAAISNAAVSGNVMPGINNLPGNPVPHGNSAAARASRPATPGMNTPNAVSRNASPMNPAVRISQKEREAQQMAQQHQREIEEFDASWDQ